MGARKFEQEFNRIDDEDCIVTVEYTITTFTAATYDDLAEGGEVEIFKAYDADGKEVKLTNAEYEKFEKWLSENHEFDDDDSDVRYEQSWDDW